MDISRYLAFDYLSDSPLSACIKSADNLQVISSTQRIADILGYASREEMMGITDYDLQGPVSEYAGVFRAYDRLTLENGGESHYLSSMIHRRGHRTTLIASRSPYKTSDNITQGVLLTFKVVDPPLTQDCMQLLIASSRRAFDRHGQFHYMIDGYLPTQYGLNMQETLYLFYLLQTLSPSEIDARMDLSSASRTSLIESVMAKLKVTQGSDLAEEATLCGLDKVFPGILLPTAY